MEPAIKSKFKTTDEYIASFPPDVQEILERLRKTIKQAAPKAEEVISYNMPGVRQSGMLVWYAAYKNHIGFYPASQAMVVFKDELVNYKTSKGAIQFPIEKPIPATLIKKIVKYRVNENMEKEKLKTRKAK